MKQYSIYLGFIVNPPLGKIIGSAQRKRLKFAAPNVGYGINIKTINISANNMSTFGVHGYENTVPSMRPYFIAIGPAIRNKTRVKPFRTVDLFGIWADVLGFPEAVKATNGSADAARAVLKRHHVSVASKL